MAETASNTAQEPYTKLLMKTPLGAFIALLITASAFLAGCTTTGPITPDPGKLGLVVKRNTIIQNTDLHVDVIGVNDQEKERLFAVPLPQYFAENALRKDFLQTRGLGTSFYFAAGTASTNAQFLPPTNGLWTVWAAKKVTHIVVISDLRPIDSPGRRESVAFDWKVLKELPKDKAGKCRLLTFEIFQDTIQRPAGMPQ